MSADATLAESLPATCATWSEWVGFATPAALTPIGTRFEAIAARRIGLRVLLTDAAPLALLCKLMRVDPTGPAAAHASACLAMLAREPDLVDALACCVPALVLVMGGGGGGVVSAAEALSLIAGSAEGLRAVAAAMTRAHILAALGHEDEDAVMRTLLLVQRLASSPDHRAMVSVVPVCEALTAMLGPAWPAGVRTRAADALRAAASDERCKDAVVAAGLADSVAAMMASTAMVVRLPALSVLCAVADNGVRVGGVPRHVTMATARVIAQLVVALRAQSVRYVELGATCVRYIARHGKNVAVALLCFCVQLRRVVASVGGPGPGPVQVKCIQLV